MLNFGHKVAGEGVDQEYASGFSANASGSEIKQAIFIQLSDSRAVRTFDIICVNLQLGLRVHHRGIRQQQRLVALLRIGFLGILGNVNLSVEDSVGLLGKDSLVHLPAVAVRPGVNNSGVVVYMFLVAADCKAVKSALDPLPFKESRDIVTNNASGKTERMRSEAGMISLADPQVGNVKRSLTFPDEPVMDSARVVGKLEVGKWVGKIG